MSQACVGQQVARGQEGYDEGHGMGHAHCTELCSDAS